MRGCGCCTVRELIQKRGELEEQILNPPAPMRAATPESSVVTFTDLWDAYLADCTNRDKRVDRLQTAWTHLRLSFGERPAAEVTTRDIVAYTTLRREAKITGGTINPELAYSRLPSATAPGLP